MHRFIVLISLFLLALSSPLTAGDVTNLNTDFSGSRLIIDYDLIDNPSGSTASIEVILKLNGKTYTPNMLSLSGDFGNSVMTGRGRRIVWNHPRDFPEGLESVFTCHVNVVPESRIINEAETPSEGFRNSSFAVNRQTVAENRTRLMWARNGNPFVRPMRYDAAHAEIERLNRERFAGYNDWRIPTRDDFEGLVFIGRKSGWGYAIGRFIADYLSSCGFIDVQPGNYWTSTTDPEEGQRRYVANTWNGILRPLPASNYYYLWPVRSIR